MASVQSVTNVEPATSPTMQGLKPKTAATTTDINTPFPSLPSSALPSDDKPPLPSSENQPPPPPSNPGPPSDNRPPSNSGPPSDNPQPPLANEPPPDTPYVNIPTPTTSTKRRVIESYEYVNNKRVVNPSSQFTSSLMGPGYGVVGTPKTLTSGDGYAYVSNHNIPFLYGGPGGREECPRCLQYQQQLDQWQRNSTALASSYSKILAQLNMAQTILSRLEDTIKDELTVCLHPSPLPPPSSSSPTLPASPDLDLPPTSGPRVTKRSHTMIGRGSTGSLNNGSSGVLAGLDKTMVTDMYPETEDHYPLSPHCHLQLVGLASHLSQAVDVCQSSAAALFKRGRLTPPSRRPINATVCAHSPLAHRSKALLVRVTSQPSLSLESQMPSKAHHVSKLASVEESAESGGSPRSLSNMGGVERRGSHPSDDGHGLNSCSKSSVEVPVVVVETSQEEGVGSEGGHGEGDEGERRGAGRSSGREASTDKDKDRSADKDKDRSADKDKDRSADKDKDRSADKDKDRSADKDKDRSADKDKDRSADKDKDRSADKDKDRSADKDKDRSADKDKDRSADKDKDRSADKDKDRSADKDKGNDKCPSPVQSWQVGDPLAVQTDLDKEPDDSKRQLPSKKPFISYTMSLMMEDQEFCILDYPCEGKDALDAGEATQTPDFAVDDKDFKQAMSKIADMEEERRNLLEEIDTLQLDNQQVRFSLSDALSALENRELQLMLAMQDLTIATHEMKKAAEMRVELQKLKFDRDQILENFRTLEDDHAAVKYSLLQQLQQRPNNRAEASPDFLAHMRKGAASSEIKDQDTVYKQGFLVKQGGLVKSWKKRLFVLDYGGLSYYKTEQPVQVVTLTKVSKVEHARDNAQHRFDVYTSDRVFHLMAPSHKEMQSWVGILQTLKDHHRTAAMAKNDDRPKTHLGMSKAYKALSLDSQHFDQGVILLKATTLPTVAATTTTSSGTISEEELSLPLQRTSMRSFQQLKAEENEREEGGDMPIHTTMSFSLPDSSHLADKSSLSDVTGGR